MLLIFSRAVGWRAARKYQSSSSADIRQEPVNSGKEDCKITLKDAAFIFAKAAGNTFN
ncbi:hypothetical protein [Mesorhizobium sp. DCY119]|uniref:hypothetical protein n=1 Tax=Mesorhizobium sp. DCY119 TaxID=2108445 RepID=UPI0013C4031A|nr:hypothetical protein [Mesorhizobium sp. DCY119]